MKIFITILLSLFFSAINAQQFDWAGLASGTQTEVGEQIITDNLGNVYTVGYFEGTVDFDPSASVFNITSVGLKDAFLLKLDPNGNFLWVRGIGGTVTDWAYTVAVDNSNNVYVAGSFEGVVDFNQGGAPTNITSAGAKDIFLSKYTEAGVFQWVKTYGSTGTDACYDMKIDAGNQIYLTGQFVGTVDFDASPGQLDLIATGSFGASDPFILKLDANADLLWAKNFGDNFTDFATSLDIDNAGNVIMVGEFGGTSDFDPSPNVFNLTSNGNNDVFINKLDASGNFLWAKNIGGSGNETQPRVTVSKNTDKKIYITGQFDGTVDFDPNAPVANTTSNGGKDIFVLQLDASGFFSGIETYGGTGNDQGLAIDINSADEIFVTGFFENQVDFNSGGGSNVSLTSVHNQDMFVMKMSSSPFYVTWVKQFGGSNHQNGKSVFVDNANNIFTTGLTNGPTDFDPYSGVFTLNPVGSFDIFNLKLSACTPVNYTDVQTACGSFTWSNGDVFTASNTTATQFFESASGCDSIVTLDLTLNPLPTIVTSANPLTICSGENVTLTGTGATNYTWTELPSGLTPTNGNPVTIASAGNYQFECTGTDANTCVNKDTITVTVYPKPTFTVTPTDITCNGNGDGILTISSLSANTDYTVDYVGTNSGTQNLSSVMSNATGQIILTGFLAESISNIMVTDNVTGCQSTIDPSPYVISEPTDITIDAPMSYNNNATVTMCEMDALAGVTFQAVLAGGVSGGTGTLTPTWTGGITDNTSFNPSIGTTTYTLSVVDANGCTATNLTNNTITIIVEATPTFTITSSNPTTCGGTDGSITLSGLIASTTYSVTYQEDNGVTGVGPVSLTANASGQIIISNLNANIYDFFGVESSGLCLGNDASIITLSDPNAPTIDAGVDQIVCETNQVILSATVSGGSISWDNGVTDGTGFIPVVTTTYTATVSDNGCTATDVVLVTVNPLDDPTFNYSASGYCLNDMNQIPNAAVVGGAYSYTVTSGGPNLALNVTSGEIDLTTSQQGVYSITYTTNGTCPSSSTQTVELFDAPVINTTTVEICANNGDYIFQNNATPSGGTYSGPNIQNNSFNPNGLIPGDYIYFYEFTDGNGCAETGNGTVTINPIPTVTLNITNASCGSNGGSVDATISGGASPYSIVWSSGQTTEDISGVLPNNYYINVTDNNLCYVMEVATVTSSEITLAGTVTDNLCNGETNGSIDLTINGTTGPYIYYWSNGETTEDINNLAAGQYEVFVTNQANCTSTMSFIVGEPNVLNATITQTDPSTCGATDGSLISNTTGGGTSYTYDWLDNSNTSVGTTADLTAIGGGVYALTVTDENGCTATTTSFITDNGAPVITLIQMTDASCTNDGAIDVAINSANAIQSTVWNSGELTEDIMNLSAGSYSLTVTDVNGCIGYYSTTINPIIPAPTNICIVTVDTATNSNLVVWEKPITTEIDYYVIFRETSVANEFLPVDTVYYNELSQFTDPVAYPQIRSWRYKIKSVNTCGVSSNFGDIHKTMHVTVNQGLAGTYNINWDEYEGFAYSTFDVWRHTNIDGWGAMPVQSIPSTQFSISDTPPTIDGLDYMIEITPPSTCTSTIKAIDHNSSRSNKSSEENITPGGGNTNAVTENNNAIINVYPNPSNGIFNVVLNDNTNNMIKIYDMKGNVIKSFLSSSKSFTVDLNNYENGMYILEMYSNNSVLRKQLLKQ